GSASASSSALVCSDCMPPCVAAMASMQVRVTLLNTSCAASDQPEVWQCVRSDSERSSCGSNCLISFAHSTRAARSFATSMKKFMPMPKKNDSRGAKRSTGRLAARPARTFDGVGQRVSKFEIRGRTGLLHVIAGNRNRIEFRHMRGSVREDIGDDAQRRLWRVDIGVAHHEFFENVVLNRAGKFLWRHA